MLDIPYGVGGWGQWQGAIPYGGGGAWRKGEDEISGIPEAGFYRCGELTWDWVPAKV